jgi:CSLREA domain-containing protein
MSAAAANAASFTVNSTADAALSNPASTSCVSTHGGDCTLRAAVQAADNSGGASTITVPAGTYKLTVASTAADDPSNGDLDIKGPSTAVTIDGAGASGTIIDANHIDRAFAVQPEESLTLSGVTVKNGLTGEGSSTHSTESSYGGAIYNEGAVLIEGSRLLNNSSVESGAVIYNGFDATSATITNSEAIGNTSSLYGGVMLSYGTVSMTLTGDTMTGNVSYDQGGVVSAQGTGPLTIANSDLSGNAASKEGGGAIAFDDTAALTISHTRLNDDSAGEYTGGVILAYDASAITVEDSSLSGDSAYEAGAIYADATGPITIQGSTLSEDGSFADGTVYANGVERLTVADSTLEGDGDGTCGALCLISSDLTVSGSTFSHDSSYEGAAIKLGGSAAGGEASITTSTFAQNHAADNTGGAIYDTRGDLTVSASTFTGNSASEHGGALTYESGKALTLVNDTFDGNTAPDSGGAIYLKGPAEGEAEIVLLNDTIAHNTAIDGGGIYGPQNADVIENTIVAGNYGGPSADGGADCYGTAPEDNAGAADAGGNIDSDGTCFSEGVNGDQIRVDPLLGGLANNGGPTETDALLAGSPATGNAVSLPLACPATDERGVARSGLCDIGAYQTPAAVASTPTTPAGNVSGTTKKSSSQAQCKSARAETIRWRLHGGVALKRILVTVNGKLYRRLAGGASKVKVGMAGRRKGAVTVRITGFTSSGKRYEMVRVFHLCVPAKRSREKPGSSYLTRA